jgi:ribulose-phosphate 3-epimerase
LDLVLILGNNPGFSGQGWFPEMAGKIQRTAHFLQTVGSSAILQVDGGMTVQTLPEAYRAGAHAFVSGSAIFGHPGGIVKGIQSLRRLIN